MKNLLSKTVASLALGVCLTGTSCIGPNNLFNSVLTWNSRVSDSKFINELLFLGMNIIPVYGVCLWGDFVIFNSIEFWSGDNLIKKPDDFKPQAAEG